MVGGPALAGVVGLGAVGGILANIALTPLTAGASLLQSYWYGAGLILGERMMYTVHWEKIKVRLDKGEDFLSVLDKIMNDDITAIANLSFKAMDETGNLFLTQGTANLGKFIEELLAAALNPFFSGEREPSDGITPPEETETGISLTIEQIQALSDNTLLFETQLSQISKYTAATQQHMLTEKLSRKLGDEQPKTLDDIVEGANTVFELLGKLGYSLSYQGKFLPGAFSVRPQSQSTLSEFTTLFNHFTTMQNRAFVDAKRLIDDPFLAGVEDALRKFIIVTLIPARENYFDFAFTYGYDT